MCICNTGFQDIGNNKCEECTGNKYGKNCSEMCGCNITNSLNENQACDIMTGQCKCKAGWYGDSCNNDVNECEDSRICSTISDTTCVNTFGSFLCDCLRGFTKSSDGACIKESLTTTAVPGSSFRHSLILDYDLPADTNLQAADIYNEIKNEILSTLLDFYKTYIAGLIDIIINDIRNGSIIADYTVVFGELNENDAANLTKAVLDLEQGTQFTVYGQNVSVTSAMYKDLKPCELYNATVGSCKQGYRCRVENNIPICRLEYEDNEVNWSIIIGLSAVGIFVIMVAITVVFVRHLSRKQKKKKQDIPRSKRAANYRDTHGNVSDMDKVRRWREGLASDTFPKRWTPRNWRDLSTGPAMFRHGENESAYSQPYYGPHARPTYSTDDKKDNRF
ncbi:mucin-like protein [Ruditapes philippinarum]|uniref:mucin-like protein n=1 Tax=Ruditapes philippinarum TaxID=129788 RepID=UPI00295BFFDB|nr:mucin-like protein [Ruditapes philippinarum]